MKGAPGLSRTAERPVVVIVSGDHILSLRLRERLSRNGLDILHSSEPEIPAALGQNGSVTLAVVGPFPDHAIESGVTDLGLKLWREWLGDKSIIERFHVRVLVK